MKSIREEMTPLNSKGLLLVISGPSGVGKGTVCSEYVKKHGDECALSVSATTRAPRSGEADGVNYFFLTEEKFTQMVADGEFLEHAVFCSNMYGTPKKNVMEMLESGRDVILEIEVQGAMQVRSHYPEGVFVFVVPPSTDALEERLRGRKTEADSVIRERLARAKQEFNFIEKYNYVLINDTIAGAVEKLEDIVSAEKQRIPRNIEYIRENFIK